MTITRDFLNKNCTKSFLKNDFEQYIYNNEIYYCYDSHKRNGDLIIWHVHKYHNSYLEESFKKFGYRMFDFHTWMYTPDFVDNRISDFIYVVIENEILVDVYFCCANNKFRLNNKEIGVINEKSNDFIILALLGRYEKLYNIMQKFV